MVSSYHFAKSKASQIDFSAAPVGPQTREAFIREVSAMTFEEYLKSRWGREYILEHKTNMIEHIADDGGNIIVDRVCRFEDIGNEMKLVCDKLGVYEPITLPRIGTKERNSEDRDYRAYYSRETRQLVAERFSEIIKRYGYEF